MRFLKIFSGTKSEPAKPEQVLSLENALKNSDEKLKSAGLDKEKNLCNKITSSISEIKKGITKLEKAPFTGEVDQRLLLVAKQSREQLVMTLRNILGRVDVRAGDFVSIQSTHLSLTNSLKQISAGNLKHSYYTSLIWKKEMTELGKSITKLTGLTAELRNLINTKEGELAPYKQFISLNDEKKQLTKDIEELENKLEELQKQKQENEKQVEELEKQLTSIEIPAVPAELTNKKQELRSEIYSYIAPFSRIFRKYNKMGAFEKDIAQALEKYEQQPIEAALSDKNNKLPEILEGIEKMIEKNELKLKEKVRQKSIALIGEIRAGKLQKAVEGYEKVSAQIKKESEKIRPASKQKQTVKDNLENSKQKQRKAAEDISVSEKKLDKNRKELEQTGKMIQKKHREVSSLITKAT